MFNKDTKMEIEGINPCRMRTPFTSDEVLAAITVVKDGKCASVDSIHAELLKCGPKETNKEIADMYNEMAETGKFPEEIKRGTFVPVPNPGKKTGPSEHLRPIIIYASKDPGYVNAQKKFTQNAKENTTQRKKHTNGAEMVFSFKVLAEKAIATEG